MLDFFGTMLVLTVLVILLIAGCIIYFLVRIIMKIVDGEKRKANEREVLRIADIVYQYMEERKINSADEMLKHVTLPKTMILSEEDNNFVIKYKNLVYNVNTGRFKLDNI